ncbi:MAG: hypothetical protein H6872_11010 [Methylobacteriaceae bacterium]|nr:hypothetical protein [Methylobacteriaceae bacterium]
MQDFEEVGRTVERTATFEHFERDRADFAEVEGAHARALAFSGVLDGRGQRLLPVPEALLIAQEIEHGAARDVDRRQDDINRNALPARRAQRIDDTLQARLQLARVGIARQEHVGREPRLHARQLPEILTPYQVFPVLQRIVIEAVCIDVEGLLAHDAADRLAQRFPGQRVHQPAAPGRCAAEQALVEIGGRGFLTEEFLEIDRPDHMRDLWFSRGDGGQNGRRFIRMRAVEAGIVGVEPAHRLRMRVEAEDGARGAEEDDVERPFAPEIFEALEDAVAVAGQPQFQVFEIVRNKARAENGEHVAGGRDRRYRAEERERDAEGGGEPAAHGQNRK